MTLGTRRDFLRAGAAAFVASGLRHPLAAQGNRPRPTAAQLAWQRDEVAIFIHFGVNTFTDREWGDGTESPSIFAPAKLDARQWARAARAAAARSMILTAKHHDGFCLWPSRTTSHSVAKSPFRGGGGDVVREFVDACRAESLRPGLYLSPWDRNSSVYGDSPRYNDLYAEQLSELLTNYGPLAEVWFDGANGEGPNGKQQVYDWPRVWGLVRKLQPDAVMFSDAGPDVRWCGNENGSAGEPNWSTMNPDAVPYPGVSGPGIVDALQHGDPAGTVFRPAEADVSIRPGWFYHPAEDNRVKTPDRLIDLYFRSVGRNSKLLLNVPPTPEGLLHDADVAALDGFGRRRSAMFSDDLVKPRSGSWLTTGAATATAAVELTGDPNVSVVRIAEDITQGQRVSRHAVEVFVDHAWREVARGTTIGYARLHRIEPAPARRVRVRVEDAVAAPLPLRVTAYGAG